MKHSLEWRNKRLRRALKRMLGIFDVDMGMKEDYHLEQDELAIIYAEKVLVEDKQ